MVCALGVMVCAVGCGGMYCGVRWYVLWCVMVCGFGCDGMCCGVLWDVLWGVMGRDVW